VDRDRGQSQQQEREDEDRGVGSKDLNEQGPRPTTPAQATSLVITLRRAGRRRPI
jgi:hypothetical protein